jgi:hypothetical protein
MNDKHLSVFEWIGRKWASLHSRWKADLKPFCERSNYETAVAVPQEEARALDIRSVRIDSHGLHEWSCRKEENEFNLRIFFKLDETIVVESREKLVLKIFRLRSPFTRENNTKIVHVG